jgi:hypothetical protein
MQQYFLFVPDQFLCNVHAQGWDISDQGILFREDPSSGVTKMGISVQGSPCVCPTGRICKQAMHNTDRQNRWQDDENMKSRRVRKRASATCGTGEGQMMGGGKTGEQMARCKSQQPYHKEKAGNRNQPRETEQDTALDILGFEY